MFAISACSLMLHYAVCTTYFDGIMLFLFVFLFHHGPSARLVSPGVLSAPVVFPSLPFPGPSLPLPLSLPPFPPITLIGVLCKMK